MRTLLVITTDTRLIEAIKVSVDVSWCRVLHVKTSGEAAQFEVAFVDAALVDAGNDPVAAMATIGQLHQLFPTIPVALLSKSSDTTLEEAAWRSGAEQLFLKPLRPARLLAWLATQDVPAPVRQDVIAADRQPLPITSSTMDKPAVVGELTDLMERALQPEALTREFLSLMREFLGCNRAAIFLREDEGIRLASSIGLSRGRLQAFNPMPTSGIARWLSEQGRVAMNARPDLLTNPDAAADLQTLGVEIAVPISDDEGLVGFAVFDRRVDGSGYQNPELIGLQRAFETFGVALRNAQTHERLERKEQLSSSTLDSLATACLVAGASLELLHVNAAARGLLGLNHDSTVHDLPPAIASKLFVAVENAEDIEPFVQQLGEESANWEIRIRRLADPRDQEQSLALLTLVPAVAEGSSEVSAKSSTRELIRSMAEHLSHEIGNALVPISTSQQLLASGSVDADSQKDLESIMAQSVNRISRLTGQMQTLSREGLRRVNIFPIGPLLDEAFREAASRIPNCQVGMNRTPTDDGPTIHGERSSLKQLFTEVLLNALQSAPDGPPVEVKILEADDQFTIEITDAGSGFDEDSARQATDPFYSSRSVGMGLGLSVAERVLELHGGRMEISSATEDEQPVRIIIPREPVSSAADQAKTSA